MDFGVDHQRRMNYCTSKDSGRWSWGVDQNAGYLVFKDGWYYLMIWSLRALSHVGADSLIAQWKLSLGCPLIRRRTSKCRSWQGSQTRHESSRWGCSHDIDMRVLDRSKHGQPCPGTTQWTETPSPIFQMNLWDEGWREMIRDEYEQSADASSHKITEQDCKMIAMLLFSPCMHCEM